jgi:hypothetical protein
MQFLIVGLHAHGAFPPVLPIFHTWLSVAAAAVAVHVQLHLRQILAAVAVERVVSFSPQH